MVYAFKSINVCSVDSIPYLNIRYYNQMDFRLFKKVFYLNIKNLLKRFRNCVIICFATVTIIEGYLFFIERTEKT